jgi:hypothetical protein
VILSIAGRLPFISLTVLALLPQGTRVAGWDNAREPVTAEGLADRAWSRAAGLRHILVHHKFEIDAEQVWKVVGR